MNVFDLEEFTRGWFVGDFDPSIYKTKDFECAVKRYHKGDTEESHIHKVATEITVVVEGRILMNQREYGAGCVIVMEPGEATDFQALTDAQNVVVKIPCVAGDKYIVEGKKDA